MHLISLLLRLCCRLLVSKLLDRVANQLQYPHRWKVSMTVDKLFLIRKDGETLLGSIWTVL
jgi:hypothetical protein